MKKSIYILLLLTPIFAFSQNCFPDNLRLSTQQEIDDFSTNYPDCTIIEGQLTIRESSPNLITNLVGLSQLVECKKGLTISLNQNLSSLDGLHNITKVGKRLEATYLPKVTNIEAFSNIESDDFLSVYIIDLPLLTNLNGLNFTKTYSVDIVNNPKIIDLTGLESLSETTNFTIRNNNNLATLYGPTAFTTINGRCTISHNALLASLNGLDQLSRIEGHLYLESNTVLSDISTLSSLTHIGRDLNISSSNFTSLEGLENLTSIEGAININKNDKLVDITSLQNIDPYKIGLANGTNPTNPQLIIKDNSLLSECSISSFCYFLNRAGVITEINSNHDGCNTSDEIQSSCTNDEGSCFPNGLTISTQTAVDEFSSTYPDCNIVEGNLIIMSDQSDPIKNLIGLWPINTINGDLTIRNTTELIDLGGLDGITAIDGSLFVILNNKLTSIEGIQNIDPNSIKKYNNDYSIDISNNPLLTYCHISMICDYLSNQNENLIENNAENCNNALEIIEACDIAASSCLEGNTLFSSQQDIDDFYLNYPECTQITGNLTVRETTNGNITNLSGFSQLDAIQGELIIEETSITTMNGLSNITKINSLKVLANDSLEHFDGLEYLENIEEITIDNNPVLQHLPQWSNITKLKKLSIDFSPELDNISGLNNLDTILANLEIRGTKLNDLNGLSNLTAVNQHLNLSNNTELSNIEGLSSLQIIKWNLKIFSNPKLSSLNGLENINGNSLLGLTIAYNSSLSQCNITSICDFLDLNTEELNIHDNGSTCNSTEEIKTACSTSISNIDHENIEIFPNPVNNNLTVKSDIDDVLRIYTPYGKKIKIIPIIKGINSINMESFPNGLYYIKTQRNKVIPFVISK